MSTSSTWQPARATGREGSSASHRAPLRSTQTERSAPPRISPFNIQRRGSLRYPVPRAGIPAVAGAIGLGIYRRSDQLPVDSKRRAEFLEEGIDPAPLNLRQRLPVAPAEPRFRLTRRHASEDVIPPDPVTVSHIFDHAGAQLGARGGR